jgi:phosphatidylglycerophosphate synthase
MQALPAMRQTGFFPRTSADILLSAVALAVPMLLIGAAAGTLLDLGPDFVLRTGAAFGIAVATVWLFAIWRSGIATFGAANRATLLRVAMISLIAACIGEPASDGLAWSLVVLTTAALFLDGLDGLIARRTNSMSAFGARFDMETDAALIMILSVLCWTFGKAGIWILAAGAMRYVFVLASYPLPWMRAPLPYSRRRQTVCIWQSGLLLGVISPVFPNPVSDLLAFGTLLLLGSSFAVDVRWLWKQRPVAQADEP